MADECTRGVEQVVTESKAMLVSVVCRVSGLLDREDVKIEEAEEERNV